jgi:iron complex outermembrane recepter protein
MFREPADRLLGATAGPVAGCLLATGLALAPDARADTGDGAGATLEPVVVSAGRREIPVSETARSVTVVSADEIEEQAGLDRNLGTILASKVPGLAPGTEAMTNFGQDLRGRNYLVLVDGIPQSTPLRDGFRDLNTIAPSAIERIEVVRGGTAVYGFGAAGGLINIITREAADESVAGYSQAGASVSTEEVSDSGMYETEHRVSGTSDDWDYVLGGSYAERNGQFDSEGRRIPPNPLGSQGGFSDTDEWNVLGKLGREFDDGRQRLELMFNHYDVEQDSDYTFGAAGSTLDEDPTPGSRRTPAIRKSEANAGSTDLVTPGTENSTGRLTWTHRDLGGSSTRVNAYYGDQSVVYPRFPGFPQGEIESRKQGLRATTDTPVDALVQGARVIWGADYLGDRTRANRFGEDVSDDVPDMEQDAYAAFADLEVPVSDRGLVRGGLRHEVIGVDVDTVESNALGNRVEGNRLHYSETLFNVSGVAYLGETSELFTSYSQGFSIADLGRVIRDAGDPAGGETYSADSFETDAERVDNYELGVRSLGDRLQTSLALFYSESDDGATFDQDLRIEKVREEVHGIEATLDYELGARTRTGGTLSWAEGEREPESGGSEDLPNTRIAPAKLTAYLAHALRAGWDNRLQIMAVGDRDPDSEQFGSGAVESYTLVDFVSRIKLGPGALRVSIRNLLNEDYFPAVNQAYDLPSAYAKGPGRRFGLAYSVRW